MVNTFFAQNQPVHMDPISMVTSTRIPVTVVKICAPLSSRDKFKVTLIHQCEFALRKRHSHHPASRHRLGQSAHGLRRFSLHTYSRFPISSFFLALSKGANRSEGTA